MKRIMKSCWSRRHRRGCTRSDWREIRRSSAGKRGSTGKNGRMADHQSSQDSLGASGIGMQDSEVSSSSNASCACARSRPGISPGKMHSRDCTHDRTGETGKQRKRKFEKTAPALPAKDATPCPDCPVTTAGGLLQPTRHQKSSEHEEPERRPRRCCCRRRPRSRGSVFRRILGARSGDLPSWSCDVSLASGSFGRSRDSLHTPTIAKTEK